MKFGTKIFALLAAVILAVGGFSAGRYAENQENMQTRQQRCRMLIGFATNPPPPNSCTTSGTH